MAGVAGPAWQRDRHAARRFLVGFALGETLSAGMVAGIVIGLGAFASTFMRADLRLDLFAVCALLLGAADFLGRTPQWPRQVPKDLMNRLQPFGLGAVWGLDLGLVVTTRKISSITWLALLGTFLLSPMDAPALLLGSVCGALAVLIVRVVSRADQRVRLRILAHRVVILRRVSAVLSVAIAPIVLLLSGAPHL